jgi:carboxymethylenebutenolidase
MTRALETFESDGKEIRVETFTGKLSGDAPSIVVLHGATGVEFANRFVARIAQRMAEQGFVAHLVHYFDRTGSTYADETTIKHASQHWLKTVHDGVAFLRRKRPEYAFGIFGYSLGGYLAAAETVVEDGIQAAVILSGGLDSASALKARRAPPVLILHGEEDSRVPLKEAERLDFVLTRLGHTPKTHFYPGEGHIMTIAAYADVIVRTIDFFRAELQGFW